MTVYIDEVFLLNALVDYLLLLCTGRLAGAVLIRKRLALAAFLGGLYAAAAWLPDWAFLNHPVCAFAVGTGMVCLSFGTNRGLLRVGLVFLGVAAAFGGGMLALEYMTGASPTMNLKTILLAAAGCYAFLTLIFQGGVRHTGGDLVTVELTLEERKCRLVALVDTGNTLVDPLTGQAVMVAEGEKTATLFPQDGRPKAEDLRNPVGALERLQKEGRKWRLLPYRAVGVDCALLLAVKVDSAKVGGEDYGPILVALSPTPVSDGGGYTALIGA